MHHPYICCLANPHPSNQADNALNDSSLASKKPEEPPVDLEAITVKKTEEICYICHKTKEMHLNPNRENNDGSSDLDENVNESQDKNQHGKNV